MSEEINLPRPFLYVELEMKNVSGKSIFVSEVQQLHIKGPFEMFVLQDVQGPGGACLRSESTFLKKS